jgi:hypothetical protein
VEDEKVSMKFNGYVLRTCVECVNTEESVVSNSYLFAVPLMFAEAVVKRLEGKIEDSSRSSIESYYLIGGED